MMTVEYAGPDTAWAYKAMTPGRWCPTHPLVVSSGTFAVGLSTVTWQGFWPGPNTRLVGVQVALPVVADTAGNQIQFAVYDHNLTAMYPGNLLVEIPGAVDTTTTVVNEGKHLYCDVPIPKLTPLWLAMLCVGGTSPTLFRYS